MSNVRRIELAVLAVVAAGSVGYVVLGFSPLDAIYQTVTTISTVGFRELHPLGTAGNNTDAENVYVTLSAMRRDS